MDPGQKGDALTLSTIHSAKGLEWPVVFIIWLLEGYFPSSKAAGNEEALEEERRLLYVAATRARDRLLLCYPGQDPGKPWLSWNTGRGGLSSFLQNLPRGVLEQTSSGGYGRRPSPFSPPGWGRSVRPDDGSPPSGFPKRNVDSLDLPPEEGSPLRLRPGDRVHHPAFGNGVVSKLLDGEKVEVLFRDVGRKVLHLGYTTLERI